MRHSLPFPFSPSPRLSVSPSPRLSVSPFLRLSVSLSLLLAVACLIHAAEDKPAPPTTFTDVPSPAGAHALGASFTTGPDGTLWLTWVEAPAENLAAAAAKKSGPHHHAPDHASATSATSASSAPTPSPAATTPATPSNTLRFATFVPATRTWTAPRTIASRPDIPLSSADFPQLVIDGRGTLTAHWLDGHGGAFTATSSDRGTTWTTPAPWTQSGHVVEKFSFTRLADGRVLAAWLENRTAAPASKPAPQQLYARLLPPSPTSPSSHPSPSSHSSPSTASAPTDTLIDPSVCDCCQTTLTAFPDGGALLAYRGRTDAEVRDIRTARFRGNSWDEPRPLNNDDWRIAACPVNGPRLANDGGRVAATWFTAADNDPRVLASYSPDAGARFLLPLRLDRGKPVGHVDTLILRDGAILATWLETDGSLWLRRLSPDFSADEPVALAPAGTVPLKANPRLALVRDYAGGTASVQLLATFPTDAALRTLLVTVPEGELLTAKGNCDCAPTPEQLVGYAIRGAVGAISPERGTLHVVHDELPGLLFAGTHEFHAAPTVLTAVKPGRRLFGRIEQRAGQWWLFDVRLAQ